MCMLDMTEADYRREDYEATRYEAAKDALIEHHRSQDGWATINDLITVGKISLDDLVMDEIANGDF